MKSELFRNCLRLEEVLCMNKYVLMIITFTLLLFSFLTLHYVSFEENNKDNNNSKAIETCYLYDPFDEMMNGDDTERLDDVYGNY